MKRILIVGTGDVATRAMPWLTKRFKVFALVRDASRVPALRSLGVRPVVADLDCPRSLARLGGIADAVLHFAPPPREGVRDARTANLLASLARGRSLPQRLVYISTTGVYGDCGGARIDEVRPCRPQSARARRRVDAENRLRRFGRRAGVRVSVLRAPGIYAADRLPVARLERGLPVLKHEHDIYTNHIHADDLARIACLALFRAGACRIYNAVDDTDMKMGEYFEYAADFFGLPRPPRVPREQLAGQVSSMALSFMSESRRVCNARLKRELRVQLRYPHVRDGFAAACAAKESC